MGCFKWHNRAHSNKVACSSSMEEHSHTVILQDAGYGKGGIIVSKNKPAALPEPATAINAVGKSSCMNCSGASALYSFCCEELASACNNFSAQRCVHRGSSANFYRVCVKVAPHNLPLAATLSHLCAYPKETDEFVREVECIAGLESRHLCRILGFHAAATDAKKLMVVYQRLPHGSLDQLLYCRPRLLSKSSTRSDLILDWPSRLKIAICVAQGLAYLHEEGPFQAMYSDFSAANVQIDNDLTAKLSDYGFASADPWPDRGHCHAYMAPETRQQGLLTPKSNVWSFGILLLELITVNKQTNRLRTTTSLVKEEANMALVMDQRVRTTPLWAAAAWGMAQLALQCLHCNISVRPNMSDVAFRLHCLLHDTYSSMASPPLHPLPPCHSFHLSRQA